MNSPSEPRLRAAIACGGTGGHFFPGLAVARELVQRDCAVTLLLSPKEVDRRAAEGLAGMQVVALPGVGLQRGSRIAFVRAFWQSYREAKGLFKRQSPQVALGMGGFTSAPPILAARALGAQTFLHESNTVPGRANRLLSRFVDRAFVGFPIAASRLHAGRVEVTGTPIRPAIQPRESAACRVALGLDPARAVLLVMGGSQGASAVNDLVVGSLSLLCGKMPGLQVVHLTGANDLERVKRAYEMSGLKAVVHAFFADMDLVLGAATAAVSRAGASSLAELAALRLPAVLVPYPAAADDHQLSNARAFASTGAALLLQQNTATPEILAGMISDLIGSTVVREEMRKALEQWHKPLAAQQIATAMLESAGFEATGRRGSGRPSIKGAVWMAQQRVSA